MSTVAKFSQDLTARAQDISNVNGIENFRIVPHPVFFFKFDFAVKNFEAADGKLSGGLRSPREKISCPAQLYGDPSYR